ncbi:hypothetical protein A2763_04090 [Candidatus Kaiserbacteria bacterium RIFCSPHIGHO2_01_FULL_54_36]|uniref:Peptidase M15A C-terminal domain-containing protein n=1 Tax=Candidatus Kaiserbacteria bacterium RIFCSPHIGHO2_01_FULL_54_36 TaxID=1798482 RepID=A0A1F6CJQ7_9BACT|nr:MAG: hypothetical protein A2763_04090 [Candidatus Kaiserbacteria bacterium RIFCSPHIGHO2_01_FULL_54_36]OGG75659.1 MAG: hypothetical protein A3A41_00900 [Candidatus Kaiserbacteria bacterium RIFCSPLOWO2_01_FULL_54_22]
MVSRNSALLVLGFFAAAALLAVLSFPHVVVAQCPPGTRPATASDAVVQNKQIEAGRCYNPNETGINQGAEEAKRFLLTRQSCVNGNGITGEDPKNCILKLDANFAILLANLLKNDPHFTSATILSGYRSAAGEMRVSGKNTGNHRRGCAVDLVGGTWNKFSCNAACRHVVSNGPTLKVRLPYYPRIPGEANHLEPTTCGGTSAPSPSATSTPPQAPPQLPPSSPPQTQPQLPPSSQMNPAECFTSLNPPTIAPPGTVQQSQCLTNAPGQQPQLPPQPPPQQPPAPAQPAGQAQPSLPSQPGSSGGSSGGTSAQPTLSTSFDSALSSLLNPSIFLPSPLPSSTQKEATSSFDLIEQYINPVSTLIDIGKAVPIDLNANITEIATGLSPSSSPPQQTLTASGTVRAQGPIPQQTFTSGDLANNPSSGSVRPQNTFILRLLDTMQNILMYASNYLKPFGGLHPHEHGY